MVSGWRLAARQDTALVHGPCPRPVDDVIVDPGLALALTLVLPSTLCPVPSDLTPPLGHFLISGPQAHHRPQAFTCNQRFTTQRPPSSSRREGALPHPSAPYGNSPRPAFSTFIHSVIFHPTSSHLRLHLSTSITSFSSTGDPTPLIESRLPLIKQPSAAVVVPTLSNPSIPVLHFVASIDPRR